MSDAFQKAYEAGLRYARSRKLLEKYGKESENYRRHLGRMAKRIAEESDRMLLHGERDGESPAGIQGYSSIEKSRMDRPYKSIRDIARQSVGL